MARLFLKWPLYRLLPLAKILRIWCTQKSRLSVIQNTANCGMGDAALGQDRGLAPGLFPFRRHPEANRSDGDSRARLGSTADARSTPHRCDSRMKLSTHLSRQCAMALGSQPITGEQ